MNERIEAVARALCKAEGRDPDEKARRPAAGAGFFAADASPDETRQWEAYAAEAERLVVAIEAMQPFLELAKRW